MTMEEAAARYGVSAEILQEYRRWGLCGAVKQAMEDWQYDDTDLERLSTIMTLHDIGFTPEEVEAYMRLLLEEPGSRRERLEMLERRRCQALEEIHFRERQLCRLDDLRHALRCPEEVVKNVKNGKKT